MILEIGKLYRPTRKIDFSFDPDKEGYCSSKIFNNENIVLLVKKEYESDKANLVFLYDMVFYTHTWFFS